MMRHVRLLALYIQRSFLEWMGFRSFLFTLVVNQAVAPVLGLAVWSAALPERSGISTYFIALLAVQLMTVSYEYHTVSMGIYQGGLNESLLRPHPMVIAPLGENLATRAWHLLIGLPIIAIPMAAAGIAFDAGDILLALPALALAALLRFLFTYALALSALWGQQSGGVTELGATLVFLLGGMAVPIPLLPESVRPFGEALPFRA
ncbi:MAG: ABC-2 family transporter protein, partial [Chloroflexia bacterium]|nr:ABC-2 family transporter protein [Chloroflexia bacterium]